MASPSINYNGTNAEIASTFTGVQSGEMTDVELMSTHGGIETSASQPSEIPRRKRRGLLASIVFIAEIKDARQYPRRTKWILTWAMALMAWLAPLGGTVFYRRCPLAALVRALKPLVTDD